MGTGLILGGLIALCLIAAGKLDLPLWSALVLIGIGAILHGVAIWRGKEPN